MHIIENRGRVYNLYLQTLYEISLVIGDNMTAASDTVSNANSHPSH